ncbi:MAG: type II toxin-antitoxin system ParD family antitoxin [Phycisphaerae bacterium]|nr:type II toxin-antitoxin system ParD family antitoxin [Planctomycetia bacterium]MCL4720041.1 type II toxin-antitoxin system ParD family antitoxin [Phycisphaerae bacterium]
MDIPLTPELERFIKARVASGHYATPHEVIRAGLELLEDRDRIARSMQEELRRDIGLALQQSDDALSEPLDVSSIKAMSRRSLGVDPQGGH